MPGVFIVSILKALLGFLLLLAAARLLERKAISQMTFFDFAVAITIGSVTANLAVGPPNTFYSSIAALITLTALTFLTGYLHIKSFRFRKLVESEPLIVINNGKIVDRNLSRVRITLQELSSLLREKNIFDYSDVEFAVMETDGKLSALKKSQKQPVTPSDLNIPTPYKGLTKDLIVDGNVMQENLKSVNLDQQWLMTQLNAQGIQDVNQVFYAGLDTSGNLYISPRTKNDREEHGKYGIE